MTAGWPVVLRDGDIALRPLFWRDGPYRAMQDQRRQHRLHHQHQRKQR